MIHVVCEVQQRHRQPVTPDAEVAGGGVQARGGHGVGVARGQEEVQRVQHHARGHQPVVVALPKQPRLPDLPLVPPCSIARWKRST